jgi:hypothetical protein
VYGRLKPNTNHGQLFYGVEQAFEKKNHNKRRRGVGAIKARRLDVLGNLRRRRIDYIQGSYLSRA